MHSTKSDKANSKVFERRQVIKKMVAGAGAIAGFSVLPQKWTRPIVGKTVLPAHAATSGPDALSSSAYNATEVYTLKSLPGNNKRFTWLNQTGSNYGGAVKFDFGTGETLTVPNAAVSHGADGNKKNYNQAYYFCGTDFKPGEAEYNGGRASVFTPPGSNATSVTVYYTK